MTNTFYNLGGGIKQSSTKTELGLNTNKLYWSDSTNIELFQNKGITRQKGNIFITKDPNNEKITGMHQLKTDNGYVLLYVTGKGSFYILDFENPEPTPLSIQFNNGQTVNFVNYLGGVIISSKFDPLYYITSNENFDTVDCNLSDEQGNPVLTDIIAVYKGRVWAAKNSIIYFSALGKHDDFILEGDAGFIRDFHTDTDEIIALKPYKDYLAIYKKNMVYLLTGSNPDEFTIIPFANKGAAALHGIINVNNKQYFLNQGIFALEQVGELNQIQLGNEITLNIKPEFEKFDTERFDEVIVLNYEKKNQVWYFIPYRNDPYFHTIWINDYINKIWFKRVLPQDITAACIFKNDILIADCNGNFFKENFGNTFNGQPIEFMWKSPFLSAGPSNVRKTIDEFYFIVDEGCDNHFKFSTYKNYDSETKDDSDLIFSEVITTLVWGDENKTEKNSYWDNDSDYIACWSSNIDSTYKAEISESNYSIQLCVEGNSVEHDVAIIGLEFKEIYLDE